MTTELNEEREERITMEIIVDAYGPKEQAMGWITIFKTLTNFASPTSNIGTSRFSLGAVFFFPTISPAVEREEKPDPEFSEPGFS